jgi:very-short-patch-repair endonuclease
MASTEFNEAEVITLYVDNEYSVNWIAHKFNTYANRIRRLLLKSGIVLRSIKEQADLNVKNGRHDPPMLGKTHAPSTKAKMSAGIAESWNDRDHQLYADRMRNRQNALTQDEKKEITKLAALKRKDASKNGSKLEHHLLGRLRQDGYKVDFHSKPIPLSELEVDILLPNDRIAIEVDGPTHFETHWGQDELTERQQRDKEKEGILIGGGFIMIRVINDLGNFSISKGNRLYDKLVEKIKNHVNNVEVVCL